MQLRTMIVFLLGTLISFTSPSVFSLEKKHTATSAKSTQKTTSAQKVKAEQKAVHKQGQKNVPKTVKVKLKVKNNASSATHAVHKKHATKTVSSPKSPSKKSATAPHKKTIAKKKTATHKLPQKAKVSAKNDTKKQYGVKGAKLTHVKVSNKVYHYRAKNRSHTSIGKEKSRQFSQTGVASYYGGMFHGRKTASGEIYNKNAYTAAHKTLALGSYVLVTNLRNGRKVIVRINDRGPFSHNRIIDLSVSAAREIGMLHSGIAKVKIEAMQVDRQGYISGKGAESLYKLAKNTGLSLNVKGSGKNFSIKAQ